MPIRRKDLIDRLSDEQGPGFQKAATLLHHMMRYQADADAEAIRESYAAFDPDPIAGAVGGSEEAFLEHLHRVLRDANFTRLTDAELHEAFDEKSLFPLQTEVDTSEYEILRLYRRGIVHRKHRYRGAATLWRWKERELRLFERLVVVVRLREDILSTDATHRMEGMEAGKIYLKSFKNIPSADVEMVLPNARLRLRWLDRLLIGGPVAVGIGSTILNSIAIIVAILSGAFALSSDDPNIRALGGTLIVIGGYLWKTHSKIKTTRLRYIRTLSQGLYFRNLANNAAVIDQVLGFAQNEEEKEAILAFAMLQQGPMTRKKLDGVAEEWLRRQTGRDLDFDVDDGLQSLVDLGLVEKRRLRYHALQPEAATKVLDERWDALY